MTLQGRLRELVVRLRGGGAGALLARGASAFLVIHLVGVGASFAVQVLLARTLGAEAYGSFVYAFSWMVLLLIASRLGFGTASLRFVSAYAGQQDWPRLKAYLRASRLLVLVASSAVAAVTAAVVSQLGERVPAHAGPTLLVCCLCIPVYAQVQVGVQILRGFKRVLASQIPSSLVQPLLFGVGILACASLWPGALDAPLAMALNGGAALGALMLAGVAVWRAVPSEVREAEPHSELASWLRVAAPLLVFNTLTVAMERIDILLVGSLLGPADAGVYASASRIATVIAFGITAVAAWAAPLISEAHARADHARMQRLVRASALAIFAFTLPFFAAVVLFGDQLLGLFGPEFRRADRALVILAGGQLVSALAGPVGFLMTMTGRQVTAAWILAVHIALMMMLSVVLIPRFGIEGAAAATSLTRASWNIVMVIAVWKMMRLRATIL